MLSSISQIFKEPLLQFLTIGLLIFMIDHFINIDKNDPKNIIINDQIITELKNIFKEGQEREPTTTELDKMIVQWTQNEVMYREAKSMGLDNGDEMIRSRLILKIRNIILNKVTTENPSDTELKEWFAIYGKNYNKPTRYDIKQFKIDNATAENKEAVQQLLISLNSTDKTPDNYANILRSFNGRSLNSLISVFNKKSIEYLVALETGTWAIIESNQGLHAAKINKIIPAQEAELDKIKTKIIKDWKKYSSDIQVAKQTEGIANKYNIHLDFTENTKASE